MAETMTVAGLDVHARSTQCAAICVPTGELVRIRFGAGVEGPVEWLRAYRFRGVATGRKDPPRGFARADFRVPTLAQVLKAFPRTPINIEIKGRTPTVLIIDLRMDAEVLAILKRVLEHRFTKVTMISLRSIPDPMEIPERASKRIAADIQQFNSALTALKELLGRLEPLPRSVQSPPTLAA